MCSHGGIRCREFGLEVLGLGSALLASQRVVVQSLAVTA